MAEAQNSCRTWNTIISKNLPRTCRNCYEPSHRPCLDGRGQNANEPHVVFQGTVSLSPPEDPVRRPIDMAVLCPKCCPIPEKLCKLSDAQNASHKNNFCSAECRPLSTSLHLNEWTKRPRPKPAYKHSILLADRESLFGRVFPVKLRIRREKNHCLDCSRELLFRDPITDNSSVVVLSNCCDVKVYSEKYIDNWHRVPIISITGQEVMKRRTVDEVCKLEPKKEPIVVKPPPPPPPEIVPKPVTKPKKGKKGKK